MKAVGIADRALSCSCRRIAEETEYWILDVVGIIRREAGADTVQECIVRMLLWYFAAIEHADWRLGRSSNWGSLVEGTEGQNAKEIFVPHDVCARQ